MKYLDIIKAAAMDTFTFSGAAVFVVSCTQLILKDNSPWHINLT